MMNLLSDIPILIYLLNVVVAGYGSILFLWWWNKIGSATDVYKFVTYLYLGITLTASIGVYARVLHTFDDRSYHIFVGSIWWSLGPAAVLAVLFGINFRMTRRVVNAYLFAKGVRTNRRMTDLPYPPCRGCINCDLWKAFLENRQTEGGD
jgi:hypothetical protein